MVGRVPDVTPWLWRAFGLLAMLLASSVAAARAGAQAPALVVRGSVHDADGVAVAGVQIRLVADDGTVLGQAASDTSGRFAITARSATELATPRELQLVARRVGYSPTRHTIRFAAGVSVEVSLTLRPAPVELAPVEVRRRGRDPNAGHAIAADEIAARLRGANRTALDVVVRLRPDMRGDKARFCKALKHVWVNGVRVSLGRSPFAVLREIRAEHVAEMRYVDCWDAAMPTVAGRDAVYVVLKPGIRHVPFRGTETSEGSGGGG